MQPLNRACLADVEAIKKVFDLWPDEILPVPRSLIRECVEHGGVVWDSGVAIMTRRHSNSRYYGVPVGLGSWHLLDIAVAQPGNGQAAKVMERWLIEIGTRSFLWVKTANIRAQRFYHRFGYQVAKEVQFEKFSSYLMVRE